MNVDVLGLRLVPLSVSSVVDQEAVFQLDDKGALTLEVCPRPPIVEISAAAGTLTVLALPRELRSAKVESVMAIDVSGCDPEVKDDVVAICITCFRANYDLSPVEAIHEICAGGKRLEFLWEAYGKNASFSMASLLRRCVGRAGVSQDTAGRAIKDVCPIYVACDRYWTADVAEILGENPYVFANEFHARLKQMNCHKAKRAEYVARAEAVIREQDLVGITRLSKFTYLPNRSVS